MFRKLLIATAAAALLPAVALAAPAPTPAKPAMAQAHIVKTVTVKHVKHHHGLKTVKKIVKTKMVPAKKV